MKEKPLFCFILDRIYDREKTITILFVIAIIVIVEPFKLFVISCILRLMEIDASFLSDKDNIVNTLAISYVSGIFVYFFTGILPETRRSIPILKDIEETLRYLKDDFHEIVDFDNTNDAVDALIKIAEQYGKFNNTCYSLYFMSETLKKIYLSIETFTSHVQSHSTALTKHELDTLVNIRHRKITQQIKDLDGVETVFDRNKLQDYFENMVKLYTDIESLRKNIEDRINK